MYRSSDESDENDDRTKRRVLRKRTAYWRSEECTRFYEHLDSVWLKKGRKHHDMHPRGPPSHAVSRRKVPAIDHSSSWVIAPGWQPGDPPPIPTPAACAASPAPHHDRDNLMRKKRARIESKSATPIDTPPPATLTLTKPQQQQHQTLQHVHDDDDDANDGNDNDVDLREESKVSSPRSSTNITEQMNNVLRKAASDAAQKAATEAATN
jgi:hypothetical protein